MELAEHITTDCSETAGLGADLKCKLLLKYHKEVILEDWGSRV
jgi:hypothetical protein